MKNHKDDLKTVGNSGPRRSMTHVGINVQTRAMFNIWHWQR